MNRPHIEDLLDAAHHNFALLIERRGVLLRCGISRDNLPNDMVLRAFALLGDHERDAPVAALHKHWTALQSRGLAYGALDSAATPELRLMAHALPHTEAISSVWKQIRMAEDVQQPPEWMWQCQYTVCGLWGQIARLHFTVQEVCHVLLEPAGIFGLQPALLAVDPDSRSTGYFDLPVDTGEVIIKLRHKNGEIFRHVVEVKVGEDL